MIAHHSVVNLIEWVNKEFEITHRDRLLFITSMCFDLSVYDIFGILSGGGTLVIARQEEVQEVSKLKELLQGERITFWDSVPTTMNYLIGELDLEDGSYKQTDLRLAFMSGDWIPVDLPGRVVKHFPNCQVISLGGATEGTVWSNYYRIAAVDKSWSSIPYGKPISNNFFYILDDYLNPVPKGVAGELYIGGVGVAEGYANDGEKSAHSFVADPFNNRLGGRMYKTGDLGRMMSDGNMEFLGRKDNQVKIRGYRVELGEIESVLLRHEAVREAVVHVVKDGQGQNQLSAYLVYHRSVSSQDLRDYLKGVLPSYMVPWYYVELEKIPLTSNGKVNRSGLPNPQEQDPGGSEYVGPRNEMELRVSEIWQSILSIERISVVDDVFELGANSLSVGAFVNRLHRELDFQLGIREVFLHPTVEAIAIMLETISRSGFEWIQVSGEREEYPLSSAQMRLWILSQFEEGNIAYNIPGVYLFEGVLDEEALELSFTTMLTRHESLRTLFKENESGDVYQFVEGLSNFDFRINREDLRGEDFAEERVREKLRRAFSTPFDLAKDLLLRVSLYQLSDKQWVLSLLTHHIISDGWSMDLLLKELVMVYHASVQQEAVLLTPLRIQYKDYALWQQEQLKKDSMGIHKEYWLNQFEQEVTVLNLPTDRIRPSTRTFNGDTVMGRIDLQSVEAMKDLGSETGSTFFMCLVSVANALLYRYTDQSDIVIGSQIAGRDHIDLEDQVGNFLNTLALRTKFKGGDTFKDLLALVKHL